MDTSDFFVAGGTLGPNVKSYVNRPADDELYEAILKGEYAYILTPRQMGKSSLMIRTARRLQKDNHNAAIIDLTQIGSVSIEQWYLGLLIQLKQRLKFQTDPIDWWKANISLSIVQRFINFLRSVILKEMSGNITIFIDEIDSTLRLEFRDDFFAAIRSLYNSRAEFEELNRLTIVLLGVASPADLIKDKRRTPFNIGHEIHLRKISRADARALEVGLHNHFPDQGGKILDRIFYWTDGHPYLTQKICQAIVEADNKNISSKQIDDLVRDLFFIEESQKETNIQFIRDNIQEHPQKKGLLALYREVLRTQRVRDDKQSYLQSQLKITGLVVIENGILKPNNRIYRTIFNHRWIRENTETNWSVVVSIASALVAFLFVGLFIYDSSILPDQIEKSETCFYFPDKPPEERLTCLADLFQKHGTLFSANYHENGIDLFFFKNLSWEQQSSIFAVQNPNPKDIVTVIQGLYQALADTDGSGDSTRLLKLMEESLSGIKNDSQAEKLQSELIEWIKARENVKIGAWDAAIINYDNAIEINPNNAATLYERGVVKSQRGLDGDVLGALTDFEAVISVSENNLVSSIVSETPSPAPIVTIANSPTATFVMEKTVPPTATRTLTVTPTINFTFTPIITVASSETFSTNTPVPTSTSVKYPTPEPYNNPIVIPSPEPDVSPVQSSFATIVQRVEVIKKVILENTDIQIALAGAQPGEFPKLEERGFIALAAPTLNPISDSPLTSGSIIYVSHQNNSANLYMLNLSDGVETPITSGDVEVSEPEISKDQQKIAFTVNNGENQDIYVVNLVNGELIKLTDSPAKDTNPTWDPKGEWIAFESFRDGNYEIYVTNMDGTGLSRLTTHADGDTNPTWSPDGQWIVFQSARNGNSDLFLVRPDGNATIQLTSSSLPESNPVWSPDSSRIAYLTYINADFAEVCIAAVGNSSNNTCITPNALTSVSSLAWINNEKIAFMVESSSVYIYDISTNSFDKFALQSEARGEAIWTSDGSHLLYPSLLDRNLNIIDYSMTLGEIGVLYSTEQVVDQFINVTDRNSLPLNSTDFPVTFKSVFVPTATVSPTSIPSTPVPIPNALNPFKTWCDSFVIFHSFRTGNLDIFRLDEPEGPDGLEAINLSNSSANDSRPTISPDDKWVVFQSDESGNLELYLVDSMGKSRSRLTNTNSDNINAMFSPNNKNVLYQSNRNGNWDIFLLDKDTGEELQLTSNGADDINPFFSPDANWFTFSSNRSGSWNVYIFDISTGTEYQVTSFSTDVLFPSWSPNGTQLAFFINTTGTLDLYVTDLQGKNYKQVSIGGNAGNASWSPEGDRLAYQVASNGNTDVFTYDLTSNTEYQLTTFGGADSAPVWNCSGAFISFTSLMEGNPNIYSTYWQGDSYFVAITSHPATDKWSLWSGSATKETGSRGY